MRRKGKRTYGKIKNKMMSKKTITCASCGKTFEKEYKKILQTEKLGQQHTCSRKCSSSLANEQRRCAPTTKNAARVRRDQQRFPEKTHARYLVRQAIKTKKLIPLDECEVCGSEQFIQAHHPDYTRPFFLLFLCKNCHNQADNAFDKWENLATDYSPLLS